MRTIPFILFHFNFMSSCKQNRIKYPETRKVDIVDNYFGTMFLIHIVGWKMILQHDR